MNSMMMDPFMVGQQRQRQGQNAGPSGNIGGGGGHQQQQQQLRPFDPFASLAVSPFDHHQHHRAVANNPFSFMHQMMSNMDNVFRHNMADPMANFGGWFFLKMNLFLFEFSLNDFYFWPL